MKLTAWPWASREAVRAAPTCPIPVPSESSPACSEVLLQQALEGPGAPQLSQRRASLVNATGSCYTCILPVTVVTVLLGGGRQARMSLQAPLQALGLSLPACNLETGVQVLGTWGQPYPLRAFVSLPAKWDERRTDDAPPAPSGSKVSDVHVHPPSPMSMACGHVGNT